METCSSFSSSGLGESKKSGLERDDCVDKHAPKEEKEKHRYFHCTRTFLADIFEVTILKIRTLCPPTPPFLQLIFEVRLLSKRSRNKICLRVEFNINLQLCSAWYHKMKAASSPRQDAECCAVGTPALSLGWLCCGSAHSRSHLLLFRGHSHCHCMVLALQGCLVHSLVVKVWKGKVPSTPWSPS